MRDCGRVVYIHPKLGPVYGSITEGRRCNGCRGWATHWWRTISEDSRQKRARRRKAGRGGYGRPVCLDCAHFWDSLGRVGRVVPMEAA